MKCNQAVIITGPTASGKSELSIRIAEMCKGIIINSDSRQVYREIPVITAQPSEEDMLKCHHMLYGYKSVVDCYSVYNWVCDASKSISECIECGNIPILVGGTGMYIDKIMHGLSDIPDIDVSVTKEIKRYIEDYGKEYIYDMLKKHDPESASWLHAGDSYRVLRALGVFLQTGKPINYWKNKKEKYIDCKFSVFVLMPGKDVTNKNISDRFDKMLLDGIIEEVSEFMKIENYMNLPAFTSSGMKDISDYIRGIISFDEAVELYKIRSMQYAKKQRTWMRNKIGKEYFFLNSDDVIDLFKKSFS